ncbi:MAG: APC family permease [Cyanobacteria bacterium K_DeepCast_0m_m1_088]|nr:APC family permease [Cyanobacteria bacterium K_DeepCast_0m_m1_088]
MAEQQPPTPGRLLSVLGLAFGLAGSVGGTIGAGILRTPGLVAAQLHSPAWIMGIWLVGGLYALLGANCIAELAACLPRAGGWYVYATEAFGRRFGLVVGWCDWLAHCIGLAWVATTLGDYLNPGIGLDAHLIAIAVLLLFGAIQGLGVKAGGASQELLSLAKALAFLGLVGGCFLLTPSSSAANALAEAPHGPPGVLATVLALQAVITTYDGWASPVYFAEEFSDPSRDLPRSLIGGVLAVLALYLLFNGALLHVLPMDALAQAALPAADAATLLLGAKAGWLITALALVALTGLMNTVVMAAPRILYGLGRDGLLPPVTAQVNPGGTPIPALLLTLVASTLLVLIGSFERLLAMGAFVYVALPLTGLAALAHLRTSQPGMQRPFHCWGYPVTPGVVGVISLGFLGGCLLEDPLNSLLAVGLITAGAGVAAVSLPNATVKPSGL